MARCAGGHEALLVAHPCPTANTRPPRPCPTANPLPCPTTNYPPPPPCPTANPRPSRALFAHTASVFDAPSVTDKQPNNLVKITPSNHHHHGTTQGKGLRGGGGGYINPCIKKRTPAQQFPQTKAFGWRPSSGQDRAEGGGEEGGSARTGSGNTSGEAMHSSCAEATVRNTHTPCSGRGPGLRSAVRGRHGLRTATARTALGKQSRTGGSTFAVLCHTSCSWGG